MFDLLFQNPIWVVTLVIVIFSLLSVAGAYILFKILKPWAFIQNKEWQAGGAIAGFLIIFSVLTTALGWYLPSVQEFILNQYHDENEKLRAELKLKQDKVTELEEKLETKLIEGIIKPYKEHTIIFLAVEACVPRSVDGKFRLRASCIDPEDNDISLHIITEKGHTQYDIYSEEEMSGIEIPMKE